MGFLSLDPEPLRSYSGGKEINNKPLFGICLGQVIGLANGISTYKMFNVIEE
jgi:carbamoylphosphate synthase small subunit